MTDDPIDLTTLAAIEDNDDPRIIQAAAQVVEGLRELLNGENALPPSVAAALFDEIADGLDALCDEANDAAQAELDEEDDELLQAGDGDEP